MNSTQQMARLRAAREARSKAQAEQEKGPIPKGAKGPNKVVVANADWGSVEKFLERFRSKSDGMRTWDSSDQANEAWRLTKHVLRGPLRGKWVTEEDIRKETCKISERPSFLEKGVKISHWSVGDLSLEKRLIGLKNHTCRPNLTAGDENGKWFCRERATPLTFKWEPEQTLSSMRDVLDTLEDSERKAMEGKDRTGVIGLNNKDIESATFDNPRGLVWAYVKARKILFLPHHSALEKQKEQREEEGDEHPPAKRRRLIDEMEALPESFTLLARPRDMPEQPIVDDRLIARWNSAKPAADLSTMANIPALSSKLIHIEKDDEAQEAAEHMRSQATGGRRRRNNLPLNVHIPGLDFSKPWVGEEQVPGQVIEAMNEATSSSEYGELVEIASKYRPGGPERYY